MFCSVAKHVINGAQACFFWLLPHITALWSAFNHKFHVLNLLILPVYCLHHWGRIFPVKAVTFSTTLNSYGQQVSHLADNAWSWACNTRRNDNMKHSMKTLMVAAAVSGLLGGAATVQAAASTTSATSVAKVGKASFASGSIDQDTSKHSCKGKNDCKGQGGCKAGDNGCKGKNSCKGKGGCATDGSKPH
jgi:hypothetical protein